MQPVFSSFPNFAEHLRKMLRKWDVWYSILTGNCAWMKWNRLPKHLQKLVVMRRSWKVRVILFFVELKRFDNSLTTALLLKTATTDCGPFRFLSLAISFHFSCLWKNQCLWFFKNFWSLQAVLSNLMFKAHATLTKRLIFFFWPELPSPTKLLLSEKEFQQLLLMSLWGVELINV